MLLNNAERDYICRSDNNFPQGDFLYEPVGNYFRPEIRLKNRGIIQKRKLDYEKRF